MPLHLIPPNHARPERKGENDRIPANRDSSSPPGGINSVYRGNRGDCEELESSRGGGGREKSDVQKQMRVATNG